MLYFNTLVNNGMSNEDAASAVLKSSAERNGSRRPLDAFVQRVSVQHNALECVIFVQSSKHTTAEIQLIEELALVLHAIDRNLAFEQLNGDFLRHYCAMGVGKQPPPSPDRARRLLLPLLHAFVEQENKSLLAGADCFSLTADGVTISK